MGRAASPETQLRSARSEIKELQHLLDQQGRALTEYRARTTRAEQEVAEWKGRFDLLLKRTPEKLT